jgi:type II secretory pathway component GspD/PulD (secretin)
MNTTMKLALSLAFGISLLSAVPATANAQADVSQKQISSLELNQADVREAIRSLFKNVDVSYSIAPEVQGQVTVSLKNVSFQLALENILRQVDATYRIEAGVYEIVKKTASGTLFPNPDGQGPTSVIEGPTIRRIKIRSADPAFIAEMLGAARGNQNYNVAPEKSTIDKGRNAGGGAGFGSGNGGFGSGFGSGSGSGSNGSTGRGFGG